MSNAVLVLAAHFDDEILGCGGTIIKHIKHGDKVFIAYACTAASARFSDPELQDRKSKAQQITKALGVEKSFFLDLPLIMSDTLPQLEIVTKIEKIILEVRPNIIYSHFDDDMNLDHRILSAAAKVWFRPSKFPFIKAIYQYEIFCSTQHFTPHRYVDISNSLEFKLELLSMYGDEIAVKTRDLATTKTMNKYRGNEVNVEYAEAFMVYYQID
ncbi:GlcNAc-PI de-N-acetylase [Clostridia bacterium]|nr:GlcNAc-PI de-N-acetylase [Clostridia bacterium]